MDATGDFVPTVRHMPRQIGIELVRGCNFSCQMCPVTTNAHRETDHFQFIELGLLEKLVSEIDRWPSIGLIYFFHFGEPLAHPEFRQCLEILARSEVASKAHVIQHTNGSLLRGEKADAILETNVVKRLVFSFDGFGDKASFEMLRGPHFDRVLKNIRDFTTAARTRRPDLHLATASILPRPGELPLVDTPPRDVALRQLHDLFDPLGVEVEPRDMHNYSGNDVLQISGHMPSRVFGGCKWVEADAIYITVNGWAQPCCAVYSQEFRIGNVTESGLGDLLNAEPMRRIRRSLRLDRRGEVPFCSNCELFLGGSLGPSELQALWKKRDDEGMITDAEERQYIFGKVAPTPHRQTRVDLGCGRVKPPGFIGVDRFPLPGVDLVADLDERLPFDDDSVDLIHASHSLEHVRDLSKVIREVYRISKHGAQICIVAPYYQQTLNLANPYHKQAFNEHTPRFWTASATTPVDPAEYNDPFARPWGLLESDHSVADIDIRCVKMEFFYFPAYRDLQSHVQRHHRQHQLDVCEQIAYHLLVIKHPISEGEFLEMIRWFEPFESANLIARRKLTGSRQPSSLSEDFDSSRQDHRAELDQLRSDRDLLQERLASLSQENQKLQHLLDRECTRPLLRTLVLQSGRRVLHLGRLNRDFFAPKNSQRERTIKMFMRFQRRLRGKSA